MSQCVPGPVQQQRPEREERVLAADVPARIAGAADQVVPVEVPGEERPEPLVLEPARRPGVGAGREADPQRGQQRAEPGQPDGPMRTASRRVTARARRRASVERRLAYVWATRRLRRRLLFGAELLLPPLGLAALDLGLRVRHVGGELTLLVGQPLLQLGQRLLALLELVAADLNVGLELGLAQVELALAVVELLKLARGGSPRVTRAGPRACRCASCATRRSSRSSPPRPRA